MWAQGAAPGICLTFFFTVNVWFSEKRTPMGVMAFRSFLPTQACRGLGETVDYKSGMEP